MDAIIRGPTGNPVLSSLCLQLSLPDILSLKMINPKLDCVFQIVDENGQRHFFDSLTEENISNYNKIRRRVGDALVRSILLNQEELLRELLRKGVDVNAPDYLGETVLIKAVHFFKGCLRILLEREDLDVNVKSSLGNPVLNIAVFRDDIDLVQALLLKKNLNINAKNQEGDTALIVAAKHNRVPIVEILLSRLDLDVNAKDHYGNTALTFAKLVSPKIFKLLKDDPRTLS